MDTGDSQESLIKRHFFSSPCHSLLNLNITDSHCQTNGAGGQKLVETAADTAKAQHITGRSTGEMLKGKQGRKYKYVKESLQDSAKLGKGFTLLF